MPRVIDKVGFPCPDCGGVTLVKDSRPSNGSIKRRRQCLACAQRITTFEIQIPEAPPKGIAQALNTAAEALHAGLEKVNTAIAADRMLRELNNG